MNLEVLSYLLYLNCIRIEKVEDIVVILSQPPHASRMHKVFRKTPIVVEVSTYYSNIKPNTLRSFLRLSLVDFAVFIKADLRIGRASLIIPRSSSQNNSASIKLFHNLSSSVPLLSL
jgi:hypothetical protein